MSKPSALVDACVDGRSRHKEKRPYPEKDYPAVSANDSLPEVRHEGRHN